MTVADSFNGHDEQEEDLHDWEGVDSDWWRQSYADVDWTCIRRYHWTETGVQLTFHPRPPHYHSTLYSEKDKYEQPEEEPRDVELNPALAGVKGAEYALEHYERHVGICDSLPDLTFTAELLLPQDASEDVIRRGREQWERNVDALLGGILEPSCLDLPPRLPDERVRLWNLDAIDDPFYDSDSHSPDVADLTYSDISFESEPLPTTPQGDKKSYAEVLFDDRGTPTHSGTVISPSPSKPLNASALAFIPAYTLDYSSPSPTSPDVPYVSPTYEFHFPSLSGNAASRTNTRSLPPPLQCDEQGFYNEVQVPSASTQSASQSRSATPKRAAGDEVPAFLGQDDAPRQPSKTREMVDRLRSGGSGSRRSRRHKSEAKVQPQKDADGWFTGVETNGHKRSKSSKSGDDWVNGLFQCRQDKPASQQQQQQQQQQQHPRQSHKRSTSTGTAASAQNGTPTTPSSTASTLSTLPSPTGSTFSNPCTPTGTQFPLTQFYPFTPPYAYVAPFPPPMHMQPPWQMHAPLVPAHPAYVLPPPLYAGAPFDARKAPPVAAARHA
ncbi:hypothetical protein PsYK624_108060 [Phanerochaete sordida]|uniref:Uncharacterized protein n=1 Tax=Phanerochaete sordida TaxID=48140 RepID=A0A9P3GJA6_9APHY|nr:hypothetical protein PsYK624_108060 [Phanerochaete sordida]